MDLKDTKEVLALGISLGNATAQILEDGHINIMELALYVPALTKIPAAVEGIDNVDDEIKAMTDADKLQLMDWIEQEFDIPNDKLEEYIELGLNVAISISKFVLNIKKINEAKAANNG